MKFLAASIAFLLLSPSNGQVQQAAPIERRDGQTATIHVESRLVNIAVNVTDEHGAPVPGLKAEDFEITEDGKPQKIAIFEKDAAKKFVKSLLRPQDSVDVMSFADDVDELVSFTNDAHRIEDGLGKLA